MSDSRPCIEETPLAETPKPDGLVLDPREQAWLRNQFQKKTGQTSKYVRHQGAREKAKRLARLEGQR